MHCINCTVSFTCNKMLTERKAEEDRRKELEKRWKYEEEMSHLLGTWKKEILPSWDVMWVVDYVLFDT